MGCLLPARVRGTVQRISPLGLRINIVHARQNAGYSAKGPHIAACAPGGDTRKLLPASRASSGLTLSVGNGGAMAVPRSDLEKRAWWRTYRMIRRAVRECPATQDICLA